jgi:hypothetical protein
MARVRTRFPSVFVGHPFAGRFAVKKFRRIWRDLPFKVVYGNTDLQTKHLLSIMKSNIARSDFSVFDLSDWNPNVALELGIAEGLKRKPGKEYYILLNTRRSGDVPADIRGIQRIEYTSYDFKRQSGLGDQLVEYILSKEYWIKRLWREFPVAGKGEKKRLLALRILSHLREHEKLTTENLVSLSRGTRLRQADREVVIDVLRKQKLLRKLPSANAYKRGRKLFQP